MAGVSIATVCHYRQRWNIPSYRSTLAPGAEPAPRPDAAPEAPSSPAVQTSIQKGSLQKPSVQKANVPQGFSVTIQTEDGLKRHVTIASDIVKAAQRATQMAQGSVVEIVHLGPALGT